MCTEEHDAASGKKTMKNLCILLIGVLIVMTLFGCGAYPESNNSENLSESSVLQNVTESSNVSVQEALSDFNSDDTMVIYNEVNYIKEYTSIEALAEHAVALVKVEVVEANSSNVRSYIYTTYGARILDTVYGNVGNDGDIINVNMPGGIIKGDDAQNMIAEITEEKDSGDLSRVNNLVSNGNTDRMLEVGDEAYLFLVQESDEAFAVVGEYRGELLLNNGEVIADSSIISFQEGISTYNFGDGKMEEEEFVETIKKMLGCDQSNSDEDFNMILSTTESSNIQNIEAVEASEETVQEAVGEVVCIRITDGNNGKQVDVTDVDAMNTLLEKVNQLELVTQENESRLGYQYRLQYLDSQNNSIKSITLQWDYVVIDKKSYKVTSTEDIVDFIAALY